MQSETKRLALEVKGFLAEAEGLCLYELAVESSPRAPCLEIGSYCGKSTIFLAAGCRFSGQHPLISVDHHHGSEEQQWGQQYFDPELYDQEEGVINTFPSFMQNIRRAGLDGWVIPIVAESHRVGSYWPLESLSLVFIDGGHSELDVFRDFHTWSPRLVQGGYLCIHDIFRDPAEGGQAPYRMLQHALETREWQFVKQIETLGILKRR